MKQYIIFFSFLLTLSVSLFGNTNEQKKQVTIAISQIVEHPALDATRAGIVDELSEFAEREGVEYRFFFESAQGQTLISSQIAQKFAGMRPDVIVAIPTTAAQAAAAATSRNKVPVVFSSVTDPLKAGLVKSIENPGRNITGVSNFIPAEPQIEFFKTVLPNLKSIGIVYNPSEVNSVELVNIFKESAKKYGIIVETAPAMLTTEVGLAASALTSKVDALFVTNDNTALSAFDSVEREGNKAGIPVFVSDVDVVERGALAAYGPNQYELGRQTAKMILKVINGNDPAGIPVEFPDAAEIWINLDAAKKINLTLPQEVIQNADVVLGQS